MVPQNNSTSKETCAATPIVPQNSAYHLIHNPGEPSLPASSNVLGNVEGSNVTYSLTPEVLQEAQMLCKRASISLTYQDMEQVIVARDSLHQAFKLLKKGNSPLILNAFLNNYH